MKLQIHGKGLEVTMAIRKHIEKSCVKFNKIRLVDENDLIHVEIKFYKEKIGRAVFTYKARKIGKTFVATGESEDLYIAITKARNKIFNQIKKLKDELA